MATPGDENMERVLFGWLKSLLTEIKEANFTQYPKAFIE
tara:strand:- start:386 stop:502 length:117 start_codon:yes stop_codon:yes gene_type:complete